LSATATPQLTDSGDTVNITIADKTYTATTEDELLALCNNLRFEIRVERGVRRFFVDGREVSEATYLAAVAASESLIARTA
jgi:hypothetical protein